MPDKTNMFLPNTLLSICLIFAAVFLPAPLQAKSIRVWIMANEPPYSVSPASGPDVRNFIEEAAKERIIIENKEQDLNRAENPDSIAAFGTTITYQKNLIAQLERFIAANQDVESINLEFLQWKDAYHLLSSLATTAIKDYPNIVQIGSTWTATFAHKDILVPLDRYFNFNDFFPTTVASTQIAGNDAKYAVPWFVDVRPLYYHRKYFPGGMSSFKSWVSFESSLKMISETTPFSLMSEPGWNLLHNMSSWIWASGGDFVEPTIIPHLYHAPWNSREFSEALKFLHSLSAMNLLKLPQKSSEAFQMDFINGKTASIIGTTDLIKRLPQGWENNIGLSLPPAGPKGSFPFLGGSHLAITSFSINDGTLDSCIGLIKFLTNHENIVQYAEATGFLPSTKRGIATYIAYHPGLGMLKEFLEAGKSYPSIPEWGEIFENETTSNNLYNIWNDIASARPMPSIIAAVEAVSDHVNSKLRRQALMYFLPYAGSVLFFAVIALAVALHFLHRKRSGIEQQLHQYRRETTRLLGQKAVLEGNVILLEKTGSKHQAELLKVNSDLSKLTTNIGSLNKKITELRNMRDGSETHSSKLINITWNGSTCTEQKVLKFDNARQAAHLIEYVARNAGRIKAIHCIRGFILFGWDGAMLKSNPKRLFDTAVSKINSILKKNHLPSILISSGRKSWSWDVEWSYDYLSGGSNIFRAREFADRARLCWQKNNFEEGAKNICTAFHLDPKCIEACSVLGEFSYKDKQLPKGLIASINKHLKEAQIKLENELELSRQAYSTASKFVGNLELSEDTEIAKKFRAELIPIESEIKYQAKLMSAFFGGRKLAQPLYLTEIMSRMNSVWDDISEFKKRGMANFEIWAELAEKENFISLTSIPQLNSLIHNFRNYESRTTEDPRLIKLALLLLLSDRICIDELKNKNNTEDFIGTIKTHLKRQIHNLEREIGSG